MKVAVLLPTYNEKENITQIITTLEKKIFPKIKNHKMYIIVADDNSPDETAKEVAKLKKHWKNIFLSSDKKEGLGKAIQRAMIYAIKKINADIFIEMDADGQHNPHKIPQLLQCIDKGFDIAIGSRYITGGSIPSTWSLSRKFLSRVGNITTSIGFREFGIHDWTNSFRVIKKEVFLKEKDKMAHHKGNTFLPAYLYESIQDGFKVTEIPIEFMPRTKGQSKIIPLKYMHELFKYIIKRKIKIYS